MIECELAWLAGLFEGEGTVSYSPNQVMIRIGLCDEDVLQRVHALAGGYLYGPYVPTGLGTRPRFVWQVSRSKAALDLLHQMLPFFGERRQAQAQAVIQKWETRPIRRQYKTPRGSQLHPTH